LRRPTDLLRRAAAGERRRVQTGVQVQRRVRRGGGRAQGDPAEHLPPPPDDGGRQHDDDAGEGVGQPVGVRGRSSARGAPADQTGPALLRQDMTGP